MNIGNYYLDINKVMKIESKEEREQIHNYYKDMLYCHHDQRLDMANSILKTLLNGGYLIDSRNEKIDEILDGN